MKWITRLRVGACTLVLATARLPGAASTPSLEYNRDVRPILAENCFPCHGPDSAARKAKLRLDHFEDAIGPREGNPGVIVPGQPDKSELVRRILATDDDHMPPAKSHKSLTVQQQETLKRWVSEGAKYQPHWSLIAPQRPQPPSVRNERWVRNPIDRFILARLEKEKLAPAPEADRRMLIRRVSLDLTGLPPKPVDVEAFVADKSPDAYERAVDRLLASPHWGEHRGRYWLDAARYADSHGIHFDNYREMWTYRDWVINAFNTNKPFDQFTLEQLAGDLLPNATRDQKIASGFNRCNMTSNEGGLIEEEYLVLYARDRTETTAQVWLGLTAGCAVCHDHKYDPLAQKEFYQLSAYFNNTTQKAMDGNQKDTPPVLVIPKAADEKRWGELTDEKAANEKGLAARKKSARLDFTNWLARPDVAPLETNVPRQGLVLHAPLDDGEGNALRVLLGAAARNVSLATNAAWQDGAVAAKAFTTGSNSVPSVAGIGDFSRDEPFSYAAWIKVEGAKEGEKADKEGAVFGRMQDKGDKFRGWDLWLGGSSARKPTMHLIHDWPDNAIKVISNKELPSNRWSHVCITYDGSSKAKGVKIFINGESQETSNDKDSLTQSIRNEVPFKIGQRDSGSALPNAGVQDVRVYARVLKPEEVRELADAPRLKWLATKPATSRATEEDDELLLLWLRKLDAPYREALTLKEKLTKEEKEITGRGTVAHVMQERTNAPEAYVLFRGEYDKRRDRVMPGTPAALPPMPDDLPRNRLGFAQWLLRPEHPLTARVTVNRFWQEVFGAGLVRTPGDFGVAGELPTHPELLDWLAVEFRESGWDVKRFFKLLVTSATYRQAATVTPEKLEKDAPNRLLSRGPRFRMDAEMLRDYALAASGLLVDKIGGPSVKPYQPPGVWESVGMRQSDTRYYKQDSGENLYRRSVYSFWKRMAPPAALEILNAPSRETCVVRRDRTDTPLQALVTLNDPQFVEAARRLVQEALEQGGAKESDRLDFIAGRLLARPLQPNERKIVEASLKQFLAHYAEASNDAVALLAVGESKPNAKLDKTALAAYTMVANQLLNLDEVLNK